ncbi:MAG TPA: amidohydrolase family protein [Vicinamibacterales bacterium]|jgi:imidazolonepropionase-like amidohydrolase|nr:amidohydrolase family protein [Vicinamibacterales bacterium]
MGKSQCRRVVTLASAAALTLVVTSQTPQLSAQQASGGVTAIVGATVVDGTGGSPMSNATVLIKDKRIAAVGPRASVTVPPGANVIDGTGKFVTPGFIDTNVHISMYANLETLARYLPRATEVVLEGAQLELKHGITTVRDSYGELTTLMKVRDTIARGEAVGPRMLVAGNIVGWGGPFSVSFSVTRDTGLSPFQEQVNDLITQGAGEELMDMTPEELRVAINKYLDKGVNFVKYGGTSHWNNPVFIGFSPDAQKALVEEVHKRGLVAETHSTSIEGLRLSVAAGIDLIQHPEVLDPREMPDDLVQVIRDRKIIGSMLVNQITGAAWKRHLKTKEDNQKKKTDELKESEAGAKQKTLAERRQEARDLGVGTEVRRINAQKLIKAGAIVTPGTDNYIGTAPEFRREPKRAWTEPGTGTIAAIEGFVELGMTPSQAIVAGTKNGALACRMEKDLGTVETGKLADLVLLDADPLADISNIRKVRLVVKEGRVVDPNTLPTKPVWSKPAPSSTTSQASGR